MASGASVQADGWPDANSRLTLAADDDDTVPAADRSLADDADRFDLTHRGLVKLNVAQNDNCAVLRTLDASRNKLTRIDGLNKCQRLCSLNVNDNELQRLASFNSVRNTLRRLYAKRNKLRCLDGLHLFKRMQILDFEGNQIEEFPVLLNMDCLTSIDLSHNRLSSLPNLSRLNGLDRLNLAGNALFSLDNAVHLLPGRLKLLGLAANLIGDLTQLAHLQPFAALQELTFDRNECLSDARFDYRPYALCCAPTLLTLDGQSLDDNVILKGEWLYSQGKGRSFAPGQHWQLVAYLRTTCPLAADATNLDGHQNADDFAFDQSMSESLSVPDEKLKKVLEKRRLYMAEMAATDVDASSARTISQVSSTCIFGQPSPAPPPLAVIPSPVPRADRKLPIAGGQGTNEVAGSPEKENRSPARRRLDFEPADEEGVERRGDEYNDGAHPSPRTLTPSQKAVAANRSHNSNNASVPDPSDSINVSACSNPYYEYESRPAAALNRNPFLPANSTVSDTGSQSGSETVNQTCAGRVDGWRRRAKETVVSVPFVL